MEISNAVQNPMMVIKRQPLTPDELEAADNLKRIWNAKKAQLGLTQESAAHQLGYKTQSAVNQYLNAKVKLNLSAILSFAKLLHVSPAEISKKLVPSEFMPDGRVNMSVSDALAPYNFVKDDQAIDMINLIPVISWVRAGEFCEAQDPLEPGDAEDWLPRPKGASKSTYALTVKGDSMTSPYPGSRSYPQGIIIFVDPEKEVLPGNRGIFKLPESNEVTFKELVSDAGQLYLKPLNPQYDKIAVTERMTTCGKVIGSFFAE